MKEKTYKIGINTTFKNKPPNFNGLNPAIEWQPSKITITQLKTHLQRGLPISAHYDDGQRKGSNFVCADFIAADIDQGMTVAEALLIPFVQEYASFMYTTPSYTEEYPKFRIVFLLESTITDGKDWANALSGLAIKLGGDLAIKDAARMFYGNERAQIFEVGNLLPLSEAEKLIQVGRTERGRSSNPIVKNIVLSSKLKIQLDQEILTNDSRAVLLGDLLSGTSVFCPFHNDTHASAFIVRSNNNTNGVHCQACNQTFWPDSSASYDFDSFDQMVRDKVVIDQERGKTKIQAGDSFAAYFPPKPQVTFLEQKYLDGLDYTPGITLIKSPKGSGKTKAIAALVDQLKRKIFKPNLPQDQWPKSILLIGHRRSLIREAANRLGLDCYLDDHEYGTHRKKRFGYAICLDSVHKIALGTAKRSKSGGNISGSPPEYDVVILDESEQIFSHLLSETLRERSGTAEIFSCLEFVLRRAKAVYALDADLGLITTHAMKDLRADDFENACRIIINTPTPTANRKMSVYRSKKELQERMLAAISDGKRLFVACNSKAMVNTFAELIRKKFGPSFEMMVITSDNSQGEEERHFIENIQTEFLKKQVLLCSPSLGTGIDISFPDGRCEIDEVIGFFSPFVNTHSDIDQQLMRVRNPGAVSVWFQSAKLDFETSFDVVRHQLATSNFVPGATTGFLDMRGNPQINLEDPLLKIATHVTVAQLSSKRDIKSLFLKLRKSNGWEIEELTGPEKPLRNELFLEAQLSVKEKRVLALLGARELSDEEYEKLISPGPKSGSSSKSDRHAIERYQLEQTYGRKIDRDLIELDKKGKLRRQCDIHRSILGRSELSFNFFPRIKAELKAGTAIREAPLWELIAVVMTSVGLIVDGSLKKEAVIRSDELSSFVKLCCDNRVLIERKMEKPLRKDISEKPVTTLNEFLSKAGIKLSSKGRKVRDGSSGNAYSIDLDSLKFVEEIALSPNMIFL